MKVKDEAIKTYEINDLAKDGKVKRGDIYGTRLNSDNNFFKECSMSLIANRMTMVTVKGKKKRDRRGRDMVASLIKNVINEMSMYPIPIADVAIISDDKNAPERFKLQEKETMSKYNVFFRYLQLKNYEKCIYTGIGIGTRTYIADIKAVNGKKYTLIIMETMAPEKDELLNEIKEEEVYINNLTAKTLALVDSILEKKAVTIAVSQSGKEPIDIINMVITKIVEELVARCPDLGEDSIRIETNDTDAEDNLFGIMTSSLKENVKFNHTDKLPKYINHKDEVYFILFKSNNVSYYVRIFSSHYDFA